MLWRPTGSMTNARGGHTATLLADRRVLVTGGDDVSGTVLDTVEYYKPAAEAWGGAGPMSSPRVAHTATLLSDGRLLVVGGYNGSAALDTAEVFDPSTGGWAAAGTMSVPRMYHAATLLPDGRVLVSGGWEGVPGAPAHDTCEVFDPSTASWSPAPSLLEPRTSHVSFFMPDNVVLVAMGHAGAAGLLTTEVFDLGAGAWSPGPPLSERRSDDDAGSGSAVQLDDGSVLVAGGYDRLGVGYLASAELLAVSAGGWTPVGSMAVPRVWAAITLLATGSMLIAGGTDPTAPVASVEIFKPPTLAWAPCPPMGDPRMGATATLLPAGQVVVPGGHDGSGTLASAEIFEL